MAQNTGTLISAAIRPNDSLDPIASAFASEIKGGLHTAANSTDRDAIIFERREWGMMCYVTSQDKTYQLKYGYSSTSIMDNTNWVEFSGSGGGSGGGTEWIDSVISISNIPPGSPSNGDRYILGSTPVGGWASLTASLVLTYNSTLASWQQTVPTQGMAVVVDSELNAVYNYIGTFPTGSWQKERLNQIRSTVASTLDGYTYTSTSQPSFTSYETEMVFLTKFLSANTGLTVSIDINGIGAVELRKPSSTGLSTLQIQDIQPDIIYNLVYDGTYFQINRPHVNDQLFNVKYLIESTDYIVVPQYYQYWVYSDLTISGTLVNFGQVIIANGSLILSGGTFSNFGTLALVNFAGGMTTSFSDSATIQFTQSNTIFGLSVSAVVSDNSLTQSKINIVNPASASINSVLGYTSSGGFMWMDSSGLGISNIISGSGLSGSLSGSNYNIEVNVNSDSLEIVSDEIRLKDIITGDRTFQDSLTVNGNLSVNGTVSYINTENLLVEDNIITLNATFSGSPFLDSGIEVNRGLSSSSKLIWDETLDLWVAGISGSTSPIITESGTGLTKSGNYLSLDFQNITGTGLTQNGGQISVDPNQLLNAGDGLDKNGATLSVNVGIGLTISSDSVSMIWGGTSSGLTFSSSSLSLNVDGSSIFINNNGQISSTIGSSYPIYESKYSQNTSGDSQPTGFTISYVPNDFSRIQIFINGMIQTLGDGSFTGVDCYFSTDGSFARNLVDVVIGDEIYWNGSNSNFDLSTNDLILIMYET